MVGDQDLVWITLLEKRLQFCRERARDWQQHAVDLNRRPGNNAPNDPVTALRLHDSGMLGEAAGMIYLSPCTWHIETLDDVQGLCDLEANGVQVDVKTRSNSDHRLIVQLDDSPEWAYVLACAAQCPRMCLVGWVWGREIMRAQYREDPVGGRPAYWMRQNDPTLKPMRELRIFMHGPDAR